MMYPTPGRALRLALICLTFLVADPVAGFVSPWWEPLSELAARAPPAAAQSGGYRRPGGGFSGGFGGGGYSGGFGGSYRRPSVGGGYGLPSSSFGGFGGAFGGGDVAISRRNSSQALRDYRASQQRQQYSATRRPSSGWDSSGWGTAPLGRRPLPGGGWSGGYAPSYSVSTPRFGVWDGCSRGRC